MRWTIKSIPRGNITKENHQKRTSSIPSHRRQGRCRGFAGPNRACKCPTCGHTESHQRGIPCNTIRCPKCDTIMKRVDLNKSY
jgi:hypothetical protein